MSAPRVLVAGVGNVFRGDDGFGVEVVRRLAGRALPGCARVADFGTRGHDLAYAILDGYDGVVLVDTTCRGGEPGALSALELNAADLEASTDPVGTHGVDIPSVFRLVRALGGALPRLYLVGCEPADFGPEDEGRVGLSEPVAAAVEPAVALVEAVAADVLAEPDRA